MPVTPIERALLGRIAEAETRIDRLTAQRRDLVLSLSMEADLDHIEDWMRETTEYDARIQKAEADLELWTYVKGELLP